MNTVTEPLIQKDNKVNNSYKKYAAALGVAGVSCATALLLAGRSSSPVEFPTDLIQTPDYMLEDSNGNIDQTTDLSLSETCTSSFDRIWADNGNSIESPEFHKKLGATGQYHDPTFPADDSSLYWSDQSQENQYSGQVQSYKNYESQYGIVWKSPTELPVTQPPSLWGKNGVSPKASKQGGLGDCWFLSSASAVAAVPSRIHNMFANNEYPHDGAFEVFFYIRGERVSVTIDDKIPVLNLGAGYVTEYPAVNSHPSPAGAWWLVMLEKAFSKLNINYTQIDGGTPGEALRALTGMPVSSHYSNKMTDDELWDIVSEGTKSQNPMAAACQVSHHNLVGGHAYGILKALCLTDSSGDCVHKLIQMRNPWGLSKYTGPWSETSSLWTEDFKQQADLANANEGEFWVPLDEWRTDYTQAFNTHYREDWNIHSHEGNPANFQTTSQTSEWISFENTEQQDVVLECAQWNKRLFPTSCNNEFTPGSYGFLLYDSKVTQMKTEPSMAQCDGGAIHLANLAKGKYSIRVVNFNGTTAKGKSQIWKMRSFGDKSAVTLKTEKSPYSNY